MNILIYINSIVLILYCASLIIDYYDTIWLLTLFSIFLTITTTINNPDNISLILEYSAVPVIFLLLYLGIISDIFRSSVYYHIICNFFNRFTSKWFFFLNILILGGLLSAFLNNSLIVSFFIPVISKICKKNNWEYKKFYISLSFISMLGGTITIIGSSTNLLAQDLLKPEINIEMWTLAPYSIICFLFGVLYLFIIGSRKYYCRIGCFLNKPLSIDIKYFQINNIENSLIGKTIKESKINNINGLQLCGIQREDCFFSYPSRSFTKIDQKDILIYIGIPICKMYDYSTYNCDFTNINSEIIKPNIAVGRLKINDICDKCLKNFKKDYNLLLLGIINNNELDNHNLNNYILKKNEYIIIHGTNGYHDMKYNLNKICNKIIFLSTHKTSRNNTKTQDISLLIGILIIILSPYIPLLNIYQLALIIIYFYLLFNIVDLSFIRESFNNFTNVIVGTSLSLVMSKGLELSGIIELISENITFITNFSPFVIYFCIHFFSSILSLILSNAAVVAILIPIIKKIFYNNPLLKNISICLIHGSSCCFASPTGYHTNLMVFNIGGYSCSDFILTGLPLHFIISLIFSGLLVLY